VEFSFTAYRSLLQVIKENFWCITIQENYKKDTLKTIILRHDVDHAQKNALSYDKNGSKIGNQGFLLFSFVPESYDEEIIK